MTARARRWSLRRTLLALLLGLTLLLWGVSALIVYLDAEQESAELFDQSLSETAHLLLSLADHEVQEHAAGTPLVMATQENRNHQQYLLFQIWSSDQRILYKNAGAPETGFAAPGASGYSWVARDGQQWRVYAGWNSSRRLQIQLAEPATHRKVISARFAWKFFGFALLAVFLLTLAVASFLQLVERQPGVQGGASVGRRGGAAHRQRPGRRQPGRCARRAGALAVGDQPPVWPRACDD